MKSLAAAALLLSTAVTAQNITPHRVINPTQAKGDANKIVCHKEETIGSRLGAKKVCLTVAEWEARAKDDRDQTERVQSGTQVCSNPPCPSGG